MASIVYVLTNESMPDLVKIGMTTTSIEQRIRELDTTSVPLPFQCYYAAEVENAAFVERQIHIGLGDFRIRESREFFKIDPFRVKAIIEIAAKQDVTPTRDVVTENSDLTAVNNTLGQMPSFRFSKYEVPVGSMLSFARDPNKTARVLDDKYVELDGQTMTLAGSALKILNEMGINWRAVQGSKYWIYEGETLNERRVRMDRVDQ